MRHAVVLGTLLLSLPLSGAARAQVRVQMGPCVPQMSSPGFAPGENLARRIDVSYGFAHPTPLVPGAFLADLANVDKVELCYRHGTTTVCPYTATADPEWLIYDAAFSPPPYPYQARPPGLTFAHLHLAPRVDGTPLDWAFPQTDRAFLFVRIDDQPEADAVQDGFCLAPIELDTRGRSSASTAR